LEVNILSGKDFGLSEIEKIKEIFFQASSRKKFLSEEAKTSFFSLWCGQYLEKYPEYFLLAQVEGVTLGYCCAHPNSKAALEEFNIPGQDIFEDQFNDYPVHLHINCHQRSRGMGIGRHLIEEQAKNFNLGMHIITDRKADNYGFYKSLGFLFEVESNFKGHSLLLMGRKL
jgi:GNAT superfamily N-acetyltransferase